MKSCFYLLAFLCIALFIHVPAFAQTGEYKVWIKTSPCSGRFDWISVAKDAPPSGGGLNYYVLANNLFPGSGCTTYGCTFAEASAVAESLRPSPVFLNYCCRDYSVWEEASTKKKTIVVGKFGTAGAGWLLVKSNLCCEEAEALSGIAGGCSGSTGNHGEDYEVKNTKCWPGSYAARNVQTGKIECYCLPGKVWNASMTACVDQAVNCWPGSYAAKNPQTGATECYCNPGLVWNATKTACVEPVVNCWPGSYAAKNPQTGVTECYCNQGLVWNATKTACVEPVVNCWPGSYAAKNPQTGATECYCNPGLVWNATKTACVQPTTTTVNCWPGSYAATNQQTGQIECYCNPGLVWNATKTACVQPNNTNVNCWPGSYAATNQQTGQVECYCNPGLVWNATKTACVDPNTGGNVTGGSGNWTLVSATVSPAAPGGGWSYGGPQSGTAHLDVYNGDKGDFSFTVPPQSFGPGGFNMTITAKGQPIPGGRIALLIDAVGYGLEGTIADKEMSAYATSENGAAANASKSWTFKTAAYGPSEIEVKVVLMWGGVVYRYKYKKM